MQVICFYTAAIREKKRKHMWWTSYFNEIWIYWLVITRNLFHASLLLHLAKYFAHFLLLSLAVLKEFTPISKFCCSHKFNCFCLFFNSLIIQFSKTFAISLYKIQQLFATISGKTLSNPGAVHSCLLWFIYSWEHFQLDY